jgi:MFS family permease
LHRKAISVSLITLAEIMVMTLWFATAAALPSLQQEFGISAAHRSLLAGTTSAGFVTGSFLSALYGIADRYDSRKLFCLSGLVAVAVNLCLLAALPGLVISTILLFIIGASLSGVYPVALKLMATWAVGDLGMLLAILVGGLTLGSATPHLIDGLVGIAWRMTIITSSLLACGGSILILFSRLGPGELPPRRFERRYLLTAWSNPAIRYANLGYFAHMWELYPMWTWIAFYLSSSFTAAGLSNVPLTTVKLCTFVIIASGAFGCLIGGHYSKRIGSSRLAMYALLISGSCALLAALVYGGPFWLVLLVALVWGVSIIADSAQFSACVVQFSLAEARGTLLTLQVCLGFLLTTLVTYALPFLTDGLGWRASCIFLASGPFCGAWVMRKLSLLTSSGKAGA